MIDIAAADPWHQNLAVRVVQPAADEDFATELKIEALPSEKYQLAGLLVEQDDENWFGFDYYSDGTRLWGFAAVTAGGQSTMIARQVVPSTLPLYLRITRSGDAWMHELSSDGQGWILNAAFEHDLAVTAVGPFAGNVGPSPAFRAEFDYFAVASDPILAEDQGPTGGGAVSLTTATTGLGSGSIQTSPDQAVFACGETLTLIAVPDPGSVFSGWSGAIEGLESPATHVISGDTEVVARFDPAGPPALSDIEVLPGTSCAVVTWSTNKPATSLVDYGPAPAHGLVDLRGADDLPHGRALGAAAFDRVPLRGFVDGREQRFFEQH